MEIDSGMKQEIGKLDLQKVRPKSILKSHQLNSIKRYKLSKLVCENGNFPTIQPNVFMLPLHKLRNVFVLFLGYITLRNVFALYYCRLRNVFVLFYCRLRYVTSLYCNVFVLFHCNVTLRNVFVMFIVGYGTSLYFIVGYVTLRNVFVMFRNTEVRCSELPDLDFSLWREQDPSMKTGNIYNKQYYNRPPIYTFSNVRLPLPFRKYKK
ncbi:hypothetical protein KUTeg_014676 [Tegillarca granosa]|uniref:Uncharacterized protein n=1 Tax=Tegillarca granosa TaxID=220873 RepID=A0ABQ9ERD3_TEGGR|nr:hypothetical protein KUTeg_014676 [Tegillarca granosa]